MLKKLGYIFLIFSILFTGNIYVYAEEGSLDCHYDIEMFNENADKKYSCYMDIVAKKNYFKVYGNGVAVENGSFNCWHSNLGISTANVYLFNPYAQPAINNYEDFRKKFIENSNNYTKCPNIKWDTKIDKKLVSETIKNYVLFDNANNNGSQNNNNNNNNNGNLSCEKDISLDIKDATGKSHLFSCKLKFQKGNSGNLNIYSFKSGAAGDNWTLINSDDSKVECNGSNGEKAYINFTNKYLKNPINSRNDFNERFKTHSKNFQNCPEISFLTNIENIDVTQGPNSFARKEYNAYIVLGEEKNQFKDNENFTDGSDFEWDGIEINDEDISSCDDLDLDELKESLNQYMWWIRVIVPILIIGLGLFDFSKAVLSVSEEDMSKAKKTFIKRLIIGIVIFLIPTFINIIIELINIASPGSVNGDGTCGVK